MPPCLDPSDFYPKGSTLSRRTVYLSVRRPSDPTRVLVTPHRSIGDREPEAPNLVCPRSLEAPRYRLPSGPRSRRPSGPVSPSGGVNRV